MEEELVPLDSVAEPETVRWYYRYGRNGVNNAYIGRRAVKAFEFTDQADARIRYE